MEIGYWAKGDIGGFPDSRGTLLGVPKIRFTVFGNYVGVHLFRETSI